MTTDLTADARELLPCCWLNGLRISHTPCLAFMMDEPLSNLYVNLVSVETDEIKTVVEAPESRIVRTIYGLPEDEVGPNLSFLKRTGCQTRIMSFEFK